MSTPNHQQVAVVATSTVEFDRRARPTALFVTVFVPFVLGYFLSYYFRTINAVLASRLQAELGIDGPSLGVLTSAYFLTVALAQIPVGIALDRFGPRLVQSSLMLLAVAGAALTSVADGFWLQFVARSLIGFGIAATLMSGLKAIAIWYPRDRVPFMNGVFLGLGACGALSAALPTELALTSMSWRELFQVLAGLCVVSCLLVFVVSPRGGGAPTASGVKGRGEGIAAILSDPWFWRLAPLSATTYGAVWALQGLWAAPWLRDVAKLEQPQIAMHLLTMGGTLAAGAVALGLLASILRRRGIDSTAVLTLSVLSVALAEIGLASGWSVPPLVFWSVIAFSGSTVLSFSMTAAWFAGARIGRANCTLNFLHFVYAFLVQAAFGWVVALWPHDGQGHYSAAGYSVALLIVAAAQIASLIWFLVPLPRRNDTA